MEHMQSWGFCFSVMIMFSIDQVVMMIHIDMLWHPVLPIVAFQMLQNEKEEYIYTVQYCFIKIHD